MKWQTGRVKFFSVILLTGKLETIGIFARNAADNDESVTDNQISHHTRKHYLFWDNLGSGRHSTRLGRFKGIVALSSIGTTE